MNRELNLLIYVKEKDLRPSGGVSGYCYNIKQERDKQHDEQVHFIENKNENLKEQIKKIIKKISFVNWIISKKKSDDMNVVKYIKSISSNDDNFDFSNYNIVHFETTFDLYRARRKLESYNGIVLLTTHSPKVSYKEYAEDCVSYSTYNTYKEIFDGAEKYDRYAFEHADYIIFPCPGAEEPYYHSWNEYKNIRKKTKIKYLPTGIIPVQCNSTRETIRKQYGIPEDALLLSYVGRHNKVKGYDLLIDIFNHFENIYVICCGKMGSIDHPDNRRWIEVGWTDDPYSIVNASDIYMLTNRETYFDIAMLQTLSIGKCSVISNTGGNKEFYSTPGVKLYDSIDDAVISIKEFAEMPIIERRLLEKKQRDIFEKKYGIDIFYKNYKKMLNEILDESGK